MAFPLILILFTLGVTIFWHRTINQQQHIAINGLVLQRITAVNCKAVLTAHLKTENSRCPWKGWGFWCPAPLVGPGWQAAALSRFWSSGINVKSAN